MRTLRSPPYARGMSFWNQQNSKRERSVRQVPTGALKRGLARLDGRLAELAESGLAELGEALDAWFRAIAVVSRAMLRLQRVLDRAERHNRRVEVKRERLEAARADMRARRDLLAELGGERALSRWEARADALAGAQTIEGVGADTGALRLGGMSAIRVRGVSPIAAREVDEYAGEAGFRLPYLPSGARAAARRANAKTANGAVAARRDENETAYRSSDRCENVHRKSAPNGGVRRGRTRLGGRRSCRSGQGGHGRRHGRRNIMAGIPVWPSELGWRRRHDSVRVRPRDGWRAERDTGAPSAEVACAPSGPALRALGRKPP